ncbi:unnamed protein product [Bursaphelenchus okinawaensis]|uniref:Uncharacterized protein n=1 Tax=Bursaphelenchus okinawaensis TaxID=465554 RepID=A0A811L4D9_9BILA|nr:unnamed protein product [Bursaphelenchus okinawaensis]CAG9119393.1 unnamed protein product [Bursaphelenchus okinawaensis]
MNFLAVFALIFVALCSVSTQYHYGMGGQYAPYYSNYNYQPQGLFYRSPAVYDASNTRSFGVSFGTGNGL